MSQVLASEGNIRDKNHLTGAVVTSKESKEIPWDDLRYIFGEIMYGGHVTDAWDRRTLKTYLEVYQNPHLLEGMELAPKFRSPPPSVMEYDDYIRHIEECMPLESPALCGLHSNAEISYLTNSAERLFSNILLMSERGGGENTEADKDGGNDTGSSRQAALVSDTMKSLLKNLPPEFEMVSLSAKAKPLLSGSLGPYIVVALQESSRMNTLLVEIRQSLKALDKGLQGQLNMSPEMEDLAKALGINQWPGRDPQSKCQWEKLAWPSQKSLSSQFADLLQRVKQLQNWTQDFEMPKSMWIGGLFSPNSYLTALKQVVSRKKGIPLDNLAIETHVTTIWKNSMATKNPTDGCYVEGLYLEGASWPRGEDVGRLFDVDGTTCAGSLTEARPKELHAPMPLIYCKIVPTSSTSDEREENVYECPVYYTSARGATYLFAAGLNTDDGGLSCRQAILRGAALVLSTPD